MSELFEVVDSNYHDPQPTVQATSPAFNVSSSMDVALIQMLEKKFNTTALSVPLIEQFGVEAIPSEITEQYLNPLLAIATSIDADWVNDVVVRCFSVWENDATSQALDQYLRSIGVPEAQLSIYKEQMLNVLPAVIARENSPKNYKLYSSMVIYSALYKYPMPTLPFAFKDDNINELKSTDALTTPKVPKGISGNLGAFVGKVATIPITVSKQFEEGKQAGLGDYAEEYQQRKEQQANDAEKARLEQERLELQEERERIAEESRRVADDLRRKEQAMAERHYQQRMAQVNKSYSKYDPYVGTRDLSPQIPTKVILVAAHILIALLSALLLDSKGIFLCIGLVFVIVGWLRYPMGASRAMQVKSLDSVKPITQLVIGYIVCALVLFLF